jgi:EAL domain-containing protein (putative c-di-GMP-specific phosphodiesterase class I)
LNQLPADGLKINRAFITDIQYGGQQIVKTVVDLSHSLGLTTVAEGVETEKQWNYLKGLQCDYIQGYLLSKPMSAASVEEFMKISSPALPVGD